jgi:hypothetical protein
MSSPGHDLSTLSIDASLLAETLEGLPARLRRKLDAEPELAAAWPIRADSTGSRLSIEAGDDVVLTIDVPDGVVREGSALRCSCLLAPGCLHRGAVALLLAIAEPEDASSSTAPKAIVTTAEGTPNAGSRTAQIAAAHAVWDSAAPIVTEGITMSGALRVASLLRAANLCRNEGMHVLARSVLRMVEHVKRRGANDHAFSLYDATDDLRAVLEESWLARTHRSSNEDTASGRRQYVEGGGMRLLALGCEPVVAASGFAGVVTYLVDADQNTFHLSEVTPGGVSQVRAKYATAVRVGDTTITHESLSRRGLVISGATAAADGRLGAGQGVKAAPLALTTSAVDEVSQSVCSAERLRFESIRALLNPSRPTVHVVRVVVLAVEHNSLRCGLIDIDSDGQPEQSRFDVRVVAAGTHPSLPGLSNLRLLGRGVGHEFIMVCSIVSDDQRTLKVLSFSAVNPSDVAFPADWQGRCNIGIDRLEPSMLRFGESTNDHHDLVRQPTHRPYDDARRVLERITAVGTLAMQNAQAQDLKRSAAGLKSAGLIHGAQHVAQLLELSAAESREIDGRLRPAPVDRTAAAWLACATWERELRRTLVVSAWSAVE